MIFNQQRQTPSAKFDLESIEKQQQLLRQQLEHRGIGNQRVLDVLQRTRRDLFVPEAVRHLAYDDTALLIDAGQTISQPYIVALMTQELQLLGNEKVLEVGTGSGYQTCILAELCRQVVTVDRIRDLSKHSRDLLSRLGYTNIDFHVGDGTLGCPQQAPFDAIVVTAAAPQLPTPLYDQLKVGGRLVIPIGDASLQSLRVYKRAAAGPQIREVCDCRFVKLVGEAGWPDPSPQLGADAG